jgi:predicted site-specific integrase-resolvase
MSTTYKSVADGFGDHVIRLRDAAAILGCHPDTVKARARQGKIRLLRLSERRIGIRASELRRYMDEAEAGA